MENDIMKAAQLEADGRFHLLEKPIPEVREEQVLLQVKACGICGTDIKIVEGLSHATPPVVLGHEFCGEVIDCGSGVHNVKPGDFVAVNPNINCGSCNFCRRGKINLCSHLTAIGVDLDGGFAQYCEIPGTQCYRLPPDMNPDYAVLCEPLSCALYGFGKLGVRPSDKIAVIGGGLIGLLMIQLAMIDGCSLLVGIEPDLKRRKAMQRSGVNFTIDPSSPDFPEECLDISGGGFDKVVECAGNVKAVTTGLNILAPGGTMVVFGVSPRGEGIQIEPYEVYRKDISIHGSFLNPNTFVRARDLIIGDKINFGIFAVSSFSLDQILDAFRAHKSKEMIKIIVHP